MKHNNKYTCLFRIVQFLARRRRFQCQKVCAQWALDVSRKDFQSRQQLSKEKYNIQGEEAKDDGVKLSKKRKKALRIKPTKDDVYELNLEGRPQSQYGETAKIAPKKLCTLCQSTLSKRKQKICYKIMGFLDDWLWLWKCDKIKRFFLFFGLLSFGTR